MKRYKKLGVFLMMLLWIFAMPITTLAAEPETEYEVIYDDRANLISTEEKQEVVDVMSQMTKDCNVIFYTTDEVSFYSAEEKCESYVEDLYDSSKTTPVVMFMIDMDNRELYIYCTGKIHKVIQNAEALTITDNVYRYASRADYAGCAKEAFLQCYQLVNGYQIRRPMKFINNLLMALFLGFLGNFLVLKMARAFYVRSFNVNHDMVARNTSMSVKTETKHIRTYHYTESDDSGSGGFSSGGFSSGGGGGGGSSGGGHSF